MRHSIRILLSFFYSVGIDISKLLVSFPGLFTYFRDLRKYKKILSVNSSNLVELPDSACRFGPLYPVVSDYYSSAGSASGHYFYQDLLVANRIYRRKPDVHFDVGSRIDGFIAHLLSFDQQTILGDVRPLEVNISNLSFVQLDLTSEVLSCQFEKYQSISCLHALEHMGLGRYGDSINPMGHYVALDNLSKLLSDSGTLYLSYPAGSVSRIEYNAHRVISFRESLEMFERFGLSIERLDYVNDCGALVSVKNLSEIDWETSFGLKCGCSIWELSKSNC